LNSLKYAYNNTSDKNHKQHYSAIMSVVIINIAPYCQFD